MTGGSDTMVVEIVASAIATVAGFATIGWMIANARTGHLPREDEEAAREYFDRHGTWPDAD